MAWKMIYDAVVEITQMSRGGVFGFQEAPG